MHLLWLPRIAVPRGFCANDAKADTEGLLQVEASTLAVHAREAALANQGPHQIRVLVLKLRLLCSLPLSVQCVPRSNCARPPSISPSLSPSLSLSLALSLLLSRSRVTLHPYIVLYLRENPHPLFEFPIVSIGLPSPLFAHIHYIIAC